MYSLLYCYLLYTTLLTLAHARSLDLNLELDTKIFRYNNTDCSGEPIPKGDKTFEFQNNLIDADNCKTWTDPFTSFAIERNKGAPKTLGAYGHCEARLWENQYCHGKYLGQVEELNVEYKIHKDNRNCWTRFGAAKSARVVCEKGQEELVASRPVRDAKGIERIGP